MVPKTGLNKKNIHEYLVKYLTNECVTQSLLKT